MILTYEELNILKKLNFLGFKSNPDSVYYTPVNDTQVKANDHAVYDCLDAFSKNPDKWDIPAGYKSAIFNMCLRNAFLTPTQKDFELLSMFAIEQDTDEYMYIKDIGRNGKTLTNDAAAVCMNLFKFHNLGNRRLIYKDSAGDIDEMQHEAGVFIKFLPGHKGIEL